MDGRWTKGKVIAQTEVIAQSNHVSQTSLMAWLETFTGHPVSEGISALSSFSWSTISIGEFSI